MNTNSNTYTVIYSIILVVVVAAVLAFAAMFLKPTQDANVKKDTIGQILTAATFAGVEDAAILDTYKAEIESAILVNLEGEKVGDLNIEDCEVYGTSDLKKQIAAEQKSLPVYIFKNGYTVVPCYGAGLWGPIWGYLALESDKNTIYGAYFSHKGETPGLGAEISTPKFQSQFVGKHIFRDGNLVSVAVVKPGKIAEGKDYVDGIGGGTITSQGVDNMMLESLNSYKDFLTTK